MPRGFSEINEDIRKTLAALKDPETPRESREGYLGRLEDLEWEQKQAEANDY